MHMPFPMYGTQQVVRICHTLCMEYSRCPRIGRSVILTYSLFVTHLSLRTQEVTSILSVPDDSPLKIPPLGTLRRKSSSLGIQIQRAVLAPAFSFLLLLFSCLGDAS